MVAYEVLEFLEHHSSLTANYAGLRVEGFDGVHFAETQHNFVLDRSGTSDQGIITALRYYTTSVSAADLHNFSHLSDGLRQQHQRNRSAVLVCQSLVDLVRSCSGPNTFAAPGMHSNADLCASDAGGFLLENGPRIALW